MKIMLKLLSLTGAVLFSTCLQAQVYFSHGSTTYQPLTGTAVFSASWDDERVTVPIGFDFTFRGETYSEVDIKEVTIRMSNFGGIEDVTIYPFEAKTIDRGYPTVLASNVTYATSGDPGNRIFMVEWFNAGFENDPGNTDFVNVQVWLHEDKNQIRMIYGSSQINSPALYFNNPGPKAGISKGLPFEAYQVSGDPANPNYHKTSGHSLDAYPTEGKFYLFSESPKVGIEKNAADLPVIGTFPNPCTNELNLYIEGLAVNSNYCLYSCTGGIMKSGTIARQTEKINMEQLPPGIYILHLFNTQFSTYRDIVKQ